MQKKYLTTAVFAILIFILILFFIFTNKSQEITNSESTMVPQLENTTPQPTLPTPQPEIYLPPSEQFQANQAAEQELTNLIEIDPSLDYMAIEYITTLADVYLQEVSQQNQSGLLSVSLSGQALEFAQEKIQSYRNQGLQVQAGVVDYSELVATNDGYYQNIVVETKESNSNQSTCYLETQTVHYFLNPQTTTWQINQIQVVSSEPSVCLYF